MTMTTGAPAEGVAGVGFGPRTSATERAAAVIHTCDGSVDMDASAAAQGGGGEEKGGE